MSPAARSHCCRSCHASRIACTAQTASASGLAGVSLSPSLSPLPSPPLRQEAPRRNARRDVAARAPAPTTLCETPPLAPIVLSAAVSARHAQQRGLDAVEVQRRGKAEPGGHRAPECRRSAHQYHQHNHHAQHARPHSVVCELRCCPMRPPPATTNSHHAATVHACYRYRGQENSFIGVGNWRRQQCVGACRPKRNRADQA